MTMEPLTRAEAVDQLVTETGRAPEVAEAMVRDYLAETSDRLGYSVHRWGLDSEDVAEIRRDYEWVDYERGETPAKARDRAAEYAADWGDIASVSDPSESPGYAAHADRQASRWVARAQTFEPVDDLERARHAVAAAHGPDPVYQAADADIAEADGWSS
ncbi:hypothetical protein [Pseudonocardia xishanensis]